jgi:N-acyl-D-amino-acid deacylase
LLSYDLVLRGGTVIDGTGAPRAAADVAVSGGRIAAIGRLDGARAECEIDAAGLVVAPGFIDAHTHDDRLLLESPDMAPKASQGVTTVVTGNCGISLAPLVAADVPAPLDLIGDGGWYRFPTFRAYREECEARPAALNAAALVGHSTLRVGTMATLDRPATPAEIGAMRGKLAEALAAGAIGLSTGTFYPPARAATADEIVAVGEPLAAAGGLYCTHMRDEGDRIVEALDETFAIGSRLGVPVVVSHHKLAGRRNHGRSAETLAILAERMRRQPVCLDCYPYRASSTMLSAERVGQAERVIVTWSKTRPDFAGRDLADVAKSLGLGLEAAAEAIRPAGAIYFVMDEADVRRILAFPETMIGSDGLPHDARPHPRLWGTFPRVLGHYCRDERLFGLEEAVRKMTGLPAARFGLAGRGVVAVGAAADLCLFDPATIADAATFDDPDRPATGIAATIVSGRVVWRNGAPTGERPGRFLRREVTASPAAG